MEGVAGGAPATVEPEANAKERRSDMVRQSSVGLGRVWLGVVAMAMLVAAARAEPQSGAKGADGERLVGQYNLGKKALAIQGYDPVSYFVGKGEPAKGSKDFELVHRGVRYRFSSQTNLDLFKKSPSKYEPLYGGWCAFAMATGDKVKIDPKAYLIEDGKLLLFYRKSGLFGTNDTRKPWK